MKLTNTCKLLFIMVLITSLFTLIIVNPERIENVTQVQPIVSFAYLPHSAIYIDNNGGFSINGYSGTGTFTDPYLIENLHIDEASGDQIFIANTTVHFKISSCLLEGTSDGWGVVLENVTNGIVYNNTITQNANGIKLVDSPGNSILENDVHNNTYRGIRVLWSDHVLVQQNDVYRHNFSGIVIANSYNVSILDNNIFINGRVAESDPDAVTSQLLILSSNVTAEENFLYDSRSYCLIVSDSGESSIIDNEIGDCTRSAALIQYSNDIEFDSNYLYSCNDFVVEVQSSESCSISNNLLEDSLLDGMLINSSTDITVLDNYISYTGFGKLSHPEWPFGGIFALDSDNLDIQFNEIVSTYDIGVALYRVADSRVSHNDINDNDGNGITCSETSNCDILYNDLYENQLGVEAINSFDDTIRGNNISYNRGHGINLFESEFLTIDMNEIVNNSRDGIYLTYSANNTIDNNYLSNNKTDVLLNHSHSNEITNNVMSHNFHGVLSISSDQSYVYNNTNYQSSGSGFYFFNSYDFEVKSNKIFETGSIVLQNDTERTAAGITLQSSSGDIVSNDIYDNVDNGINFFYSSDSTINGNQINDNENQGIWFEGAYNNVINGNNIYYNRQGIRLNRSYDNEIVNNEIYKTQGSGLILLDGSNNNLIEDNDFHDTGLNAGWSGSILIIGSVENQIIRNLIHQGNEDGILLSNANGTTIEENTINSNGWRGIYVEYSHFITIVDNEFAWNDGYAIAFDAQSSNNEVKDNYFFDNADGKESQAQDNGTDNLFDKNYWSEWVSPDSDYDGIVDNPYSIDGTASNWDYNPIAEPQITTTTSTTTSPAITPSFDFLMMLFSLISVFVLRKKR